MNKAALAIGGLAILAAGGGMYWYFGIHAKEVQRHAAQGEITTWEARLDAARACIVGDKPASADLGEALSVRELSPDPWDSKTCTKLFGALSRGPTEDTGMMNVEHAWMTLDRAATKAATAFAVHKDPFGMTASDIRKGVSDLPTALSELDAAHANLRASAGLPPRAAAAGPRLAAAQVLPLVLGTDPVNEIELRTVSRGAVVLPVVAKDKMGELALVAGQAPAPATSNSVGQMRAIPVGTWGLQVANEELVAGAIDDANALTAPTSIMKTGRGQVYAVVGSRDTGAFAVTTIDEKTLITTLVFGHAIDGTFALDKPDAVAGVWVTTDPTAGKAFVAWTSPSPDRNEDDVALRATILDGTSPATRFVELGSGVPRAMCMTTTHAWLSTFNQEVLRTDGTVMAPVVGATPGFYLKTCGDTAALLTNGATQFSVCTDACRKVLLRGARATQVSTLAGDQVVAALVLDRVLAVWRENKEPLFFALPEAYSARLALSDGKVLDIVAQNVAARDADHEVVVLRVPLT